MYMYLSCPATTSFSAILQGKLSNSCLQRIKLLLLVILYFYSHQLETEKIQRASETRNKSGTYQISSVGK